MHWLYIFFLDCRDTSTRLTVLLLSIITVINYVLINNDQYYSVVTSPARLATTLTPPLVFSRDLSLKRKSFPLLDSECALTQTSQSVGRSDWMYCNVRIWLVEMWVWGLGGVRSDLLRVLYCKCDWLIGCLSTGQNRVVPKDSWENSLPLPGQAVGLL